MTTLTCPDEGTLRAFADREDDNHAERAAHIRSCLTCRRALRDLRADADFAQTQLSRAMQEPDPGTSDTANAAGAGQYVPAAPVDPPPPRRHWGRVAVAAAASVLVAGLVITPAGRSIASSLLSAFHSEKVVAVSVTNLDAQQAASVLQQLGTTADHVPAGEQAGQVDSLAQAQELVDFPIAQADPTDLPAGVVAEPSVGYSPEHQLTVTFDEQKTRDYLAGVGAGDVAVPAGLGEQKLFITFPQAVALQYPGEGDRMLIVGTADAVDVRTEGPMDLTQLRDFLLGVPGMPPALTDQLGSVDAIGGALPIPIPVDELSGDETTIDGHDAVQVSQPGIGGGVIWQDGDRLVAVGGTYPMEEIVQVAEGLTE
ncbi:MAG: hypothetical protein ACK5MT_20955 [Actinomycetales bacterium]